MRCPDCPQLDATRMPVGWKPRPTCCTARQGSRLVLFFRQEGFYPLHLPLSDDIGAHAKANPGTLRVEDVLGNVLWRLN